MLQERFRGAHVLQRDENGLEKCVACFLCAAACPSNCIYIEAAENTAEQRISSAERYAKVYNIDYNRCIFCGYCVEACPTDAITHGHGFELASLNATTMVMRKEDMLVPKVGMPVNWWPFRFRQIVCFFSSEVITPAAGQSLQSKLRMPAFHQIFFQCVRL